MRLCNSVKVFQDGTLRVPDEFNLCMYLVPGFYMVIHQLVIVIINYVLFINLQGITEISGGRTGE